MTSFSLRCTTCQATLRVKNAAAIGLILPCPRCGSMVEVVAPQAIDTSPHPHTTESIEVANRGTIEAAVPPSDELSVDRAQAPADVVSSASPMLESAARWWLPIGAGAVSVALLAGGLWRALSVDEPSDRVAGALHAATLPINTDAPAVAVVVNNSAQASDTEPPNTPPSEATQNDATAAPAESDLPAVAQEHSDGISAAGVSASVPPAVNQTESAPQPQAPNLAQTPGADEPTSAEQPGESAEPAPREPNAFDEHVAKKPSLVLDDLPKSLLEPAPPIDVQSVEPGASIEVAPQAAAPPDDRVEAEEHLRRIPPVVVDVTPRLATVLTSIEIRDAPLFRALDTLAGLAGVSISLEVDAIQAAGVQVDEPISLSARSVAIGQALNQALGSIGLTAQEANGQLLVVPASTEKKRKAKYAIDDLLRAGDPPIEDLTELVRAAIRGGDSPDGGDAFELSFTNGAISLSAGEVQHDRVIELCEKLRVARGRPLRSRFSIERPDPRFDPRRFELASRRTRAAALLAQPVTAGVGRPASLREVVGFLSRQSGGTILLNAGTLAAAGLAVDTEARVVANAEPLDQVLVRLLTPLGLTYRVVNDEVLEITTQKALARQRNLELYPLRGLNLGGKDAEEFEEYRDRLLASAGIDSSAAAVFYDSPSQCLVVLASYPDQIKLERAVQERKRPSIAGSD